MSNWSKRRIPFIPNMETPKTYECKVCGSKIIPRISDKCIVYATERTGGLAGAMSGENKEPKLYDAFDCKVCGCQFVAKERLRVFLNEKRYI